MFNPKIVLFIWLFINELVKSESDWKTRPCSSLLLGQYKCSQPQIDHVKQTAVNCLSNGTVMVPCFPATNVICEEKTFDGKTIAFYKEAQCRYVTNYHYQTAVLLSIFLGIFGIDRIYLGINPLE
jgi:hypothetical protein